MSSNAKSRFPQPVPLVLKLAMAIAAFLILLCIIFFNCPFFSDNEGPSSSAFVIIGLVVMRISNAKN